VTFCDISKCHNVTILNFVTFLGFCHTVCIFEFFLAKPKMSKKHRNVTNVTNVTNQQPLQGSFQTFRKFLSFETSFCCCLARTNLESWYWLSLRSRFEIRLGTSLTVRHKPRNITKFKIATLWHFEMSQNVTHFQILVQSYVYLLCVDWALNGSEHV